MNMRIVYSGLLGGALSALALILPLYDILPSYYTAEWYPVPLALGLLGYAIAVVIAIGTGYVAARWGWAESAGARIRAGAVAGTLAGMIAWLDIGAAAAGVAGSGLLLDFGAHRAGEIELLRLLAETIVRIAWNTHWTFWVSIAGGGLLGALGGGIYARQATLGWNATPRAIHATIWKATGMTLLIGAAEMLLISVGICTLLARKTADAAIQSNAKLSYPASLILNLPVATMLAVLIVSVWWNWQWVARQWHHDERRLRQSAKLIAIFTIAVPLLVLALLSLISPPLFAAPLFLAGVMLLLGITLVSLQVARRTIDVKPVDVAPLCLHDWLDYVLLNGSLWSAIQMLGIGAVAISIIAGPIRFISVLSEGQGISENIPTAAETIRNIFRYQFFGSLLAAATILPLMIIFLVYVWQRDRVFRLFVFIARPFAWLYTRATRRLRPHIWQQIRRNALWVAVAAILLVMIGVALSTTPVPWSRVESSLTSGLPPGLPGRIVVDGQDAPAEPILNMFDLATSLDGQVLLVQTNLGGVFSSTDGGNSWHPINQGLEQLDVTRLTGIRLTIGPDDHSLFIGTSDSGVWRFDDQIDSWQPFNQGLAGVSVEELTVGADGQGLYVVTGEGVFRLDERSQHWQPIGQQLRESLITELAVTAGGRYLLATSSVGEVFRSDDYGQSWRRVYRDSKLSSLVRLSFGNTDQQVFALINTSPSVIRSDDGGLNWKVLDLGIPSEQLQTQLPAPEGTPTPGGPPPGGPPNSTRSWIRDLVVHGRRIFVVTYRHILRSDDSGATWQQHLLEPPVTNVNALGVGADGQRLFVASSERGALRSDDGGATWRPINAGLSDLRQPDLYVAPDERRLIADVSGLGYFISDDEGRTWHPANDVAPRDLQTHAELRYLFAAKHDSLPFEPQAVAIRDGKAVLYRFQGAMIMQRAEGAAPLISNAPSLYPGAVAVAWAFLLWTRDNAAPLTIILGLSVLMVLAYVYSTIGRPNRFRVATVLWLLFHPRHILAAAGYRSFRQRWGAGGALEQLIVLRSPTDAPFVAGELDADLRRLGAVYDEERLQEALTNLDRRGLLSRSNGAYEVGEPLLAQLQRRESTADEAARLAAQTRQEHPLYTEAQRFLSQVGFTVCPADPFGLLCSSESQIWKEISPLYVRLVLERALDIDEFQALYVAAAAAYGGDVRGRTAAVVIDRPPRASHLYQIFALRAERGLTTVPLPGSLLTQARLVSTEKEALLEQLDLYTGRTDLYDMRTAVTDVLSFFGRSTLLADLQHRLTSGRSAIIFGVRKVGKSSLMGRLREECGWPVATVDLEGHVEGLEYVYEDALHGWHAAISATFPNLALPEPSEVRDAPNLTGQAQSFRQAVNKLLALLEEQPGRPGLMLLLDEMDVVLDQPRYYEFAAVLRSVAEDPRCRSRFSIIMAGLDPVLNRLDRIAERRNPFFAFFNEVPLGLLDLQDARTMVISLGGQMGVSYTDEALKILVETGGGHPFLTRQLCSLAIRGRERPTTIESERAVWALDEYLRQARSYLSESLWALDNGGPAPAETALLSALAAEPLPDEALIPADLSAEDRRARQIALDHLRDQSLIDRGPEGWAITIPLYRRWIQHYILALSGVIAEEHR